jgi:hypothetical protein
MGLRAYVVQKEIGDQVFDCYDPQEWFDRLQRLGKFDNGCWMEFTEGELDDMEADDKWPLTDDDKAIVADIRKALKASGRDYLYLEYC